MTFQQLSFVVEVANCESINKAAERLYTSQSNVSNSIKALEEELGIQIFLRTKKGVSVTEEGREFLSYANEIIDKKIFVEDLYAKSHFRKQYFSVSSHAILLSQHAHHKALAADFRRPRRLYLYQAEKTVFLRCSG